MTDNINLYCLKHKFLRLFRERISIKDCAAQIIEISPSEELISPIAIFEKHHLTKITGPGVNSSIAQEIQKLYGGKGKHSASIIYILYNSIYVRGYVYNNTFKHQSTSIK